MTFLWKEKDLLYYFVSLSNKKRTRYREAIDTHNIYNKNTIYQ